MVNRIPEGKDHVLVRNLIALCREKLGLPVEHAGNLPDTPEITGYLLRIPSFLNSQSGKPYLESVQNIADRILKHPSPGPGKAEMKTDFSDEEVEDIINLIETLEDGIFSTTTRSACKLRMYFKPADVVDFLISRGVSHEAFYRQ